MLFAVNRYNCIQTQNVSMLQQFTFFYCYGVNPFILNGKRFISFKGKQIATFVSKLEMHKKIMSFPSPCQVQQCFFLLKSTHLINKIVSIFVSIFKFTQVLDQIVKLVYTNEA